MGTLAKVCNKGLKDLKIVEYIKERKITMEELSDAFMQCQAGLGLWMRFFRKFH